MLLLLRSSGDSAAGTMWPQRWRSCRGFVLEPRSPRGDPARQREIFLSQYSALRPAQVFSLPFSRIHSKQGLRSAAGGPGAGGRGASGFGPGYGRPRQSEDCDRSWRRRREAPADLGPECALDRDAGRRSEMGRLPRRQCVCAAVRTRRTFGVAVVEALACGLPVRCADLRQSREYLAGYCPR